MASQPNEHEEVRRVKDLVSGLEAVEDPADRFKRATQLLATWTDQQTRLSEIRQQVVVSLRAENVSYRKIASMLGISLVRVQQIEKGLSAGPNKARKTAVESNESGDGGHDTESSLGDTESR